MMRPHWVKVSNSTGTMPKGRHGHRAVAIKELIVTFAGGNEGILSDLMVFNTQKNNWFKPTVKGDIPAGRASYGFVVDKTRILVFGGMLEYMEFTDELFELQASRWEWKKLYPRPPDLKPPPLPRLGHSFTLCGDKVYLFGGLTADTSTCKDNFYTRYLNDLYTLDWTDGVMSWKIPVTYGKVPSPRESHSAVAHTDGMGNQRLIIYGGMSGNRLGDLWLLNINSLTWSEVEPSALSPLPRSLHTSIVIGDQMFVFGGWIPVSSSDMRQSIYDREWKVTNQLVCLDLVTMLWKDLTNCFPKESPKARAGHAAVEVNGRMYVWSGRDGYRRAWNNQVCCQDMWYLDIDAPPIVGRPQLVKGELGCLEIQWPAVPSVEFYLLQIQKYEINSSPIAAKNSVQFCFPKSAVPNGQGGTNFLPNLPVSHVNGVEPCSSSMSHSNVTPALLNGKDSHVNFLEPSSATFLAPAPRFQMSVPRPPMVHKLSFQDASSQINKAGVTYTLPKLQSIPKQQIPSLRPVSMSFVRVNNPKSISELCQKSFTVSRTNLVRLTNPLPHNSKPQTFIVKNPGFKLVAVNKDSQIKLVHSHNSHVLNKITSSTNKIELPPSSADGNFQLLKKPKLMVSEPTQGEIIPVKSINLEAHEQNPCGTVGSSIKNPVFDDIKVPAFPERVQIKKCKKTGGIFLSWTPPPGDIVASYKVTLFVKEDVSPTGSKVVYSGTKPECYILKNYLDSAQVDESGGTQSVKFTIAAKNSKGIGPALVVKWVLNPSTSKM